jgi:hypothetical protein
MGEVIRAAGSLRVRARALARVARRCGFELRLVDQADGVIEAVRLSDGALLGAKRVGGGRWCAWIEHYQDKQVTIGAGGLPTRRAGGLPTVRRVSSWTLWLTGPDGRRGMCGRDAITALAGAMETHRVELTEGRATHIEVDP